MIYDTELGRMKRSNMHYITRYITAPGWGIGVSLIFARMRNTTLSHV